MRAKSILQTIGNTPHIRLNRLFDPRVEVWMKAERANPGGSIKDRIGLSMIEDAEQRGILTPDSVIVEPTSGNTGVGLAMQNHHSAKKAFPPGVWLWGDKGQVSSQGSFSNWGLDILPYAEEESLRSLYNPKAVIDHLGPDAAAIGYTIKTAIVR